MYTYIYVYTHVNSICVCVLSYLHAVERSQGINSLIVTIMHCCAGMMYVFAVGLAAVMSWLCIH